MKERLNLNDIILNAIEDIKLTIDFINNENIRLLYQPQDIAFEADRGRITQVISNLLTNAIKFTKKGNITLATKIDEDNSQVVVTVKDTGSGHKS